MAKASSFICDPNPEQLECPICTDLFKNPVSLPCGHIFCDACINRHWKDSKSLKLCVNTLLREIVDNYVQDYVPGDCERPPSEKVVLCDCCLHTRRKAAKTCLVCLTSYCKTHLEPHLRVATLKRHKLSDPVPKLEEKMCTEHNRILEKVGTSDKMVCVLCANNRIYDYSECEDNNAQPEKQMKDVQYVKLNNKKSRKIKKSRAPFESMAEDEGNGNVNIWHNNILYSFLPLPLHQGFSSGRVYYDVPIETNSTWDLGVVNKKLCGNMTFSTNTKGIWVVRYNSFMQCPAGHTNTVQIPDRILVCVDYRQGLMFLCHPADLTVLFCFTNCKFREKLFLFSAKGPLETCTICMRRNIAETVLLIVLVIILMIVIT